MKNILLITLLTSFTTFAGQKLGDCQAIVDEVLDGDTVSVNTITCLKDGRHAVTRNVRVDIRLIGIDTPEMKGKLPCEQQKALEVKALVEKYIKPNDIIKIISVKDDKFGGRYDGDIIINDVSLSSILLQSGLAYKYYGGTKKQINWCNR